MGVNLDIYRARIGVFNFVKQAKRMRKVKPCKTAKTKGAWLDDYAHMAMPLLTVLILAYYFTPIGQAWNAQQTWQPPVSGNHTGTGLYNDII